MCTRGFILSNQKSEVPFVHSPACRTFGVIHAVVCYSTVKTSRVKAVYISPENNRDRVRQITVDEESDLVGQRLRLALVGYTFLNQILLGALIEAWS